MLLLRHHRSVNDTPCFSSNNLSIVNFYTSNLRVRAQNYDRLAIFGEFDLDSAQYLPVSVTLFLSSIYLNFDAGTLPFLMFHQSFLRLSLETIFFFAERVK